MSASGHSKIGRSRRHGKGRLSPGPPKRSGWRECFRLKHSESWAYAALGALLLGGIAWHLVDEAMVNIIVRVQPGRKECLRWVEHLRAAGYRVWVRQDSDLRATRRQLHVPDRLAACHTAVWVQGQPFVIEGHVPADVIARLIKEHPAIGGIAVPGAPIGAPGLEGPGAESYDVWAFTIDGREMRIAHRDPPLATP